MLLFEEDYSKQEEFFQNLNNNENQEKQITSIFKRSLHIRVSQYKDLYPCLSSRNWDINKLKERIERDYAVNDVIIEGITVQSVI